MENGGLWVFSKAWSSSSDFIMLFVLSFPALQLACTQLLCVKHLLSDFSPAHGGRDNSPVQPSMVWGVSIDFKIQEQRRSQRVLHLRRAKAFSAAHLCCTASSAATSQRCPTGFRSEATELRKPPQEEFCSLALCIIFLEVAIRR